MSRTAHEETILPLQRGRREVRDVTHLRSTWLRGSVDTLRARGLFERYLTALPAMHHDAIRSAVAGAWLPVSLATAHYEACERLELAPTDRREIAKSIASQASKLFFSLVASAASHAGTTPWTVLGQLDRLWERVWVGGAVGVVKLGPKDARVDVAGFPLARSAYVRMALVGVLNGICDPFCTKAYVKERDALRKPTGLSYSVVWA